jgi:hypothetical protein
MPSNLPHEELARRRAWLVASVFTPPTASGSTISRVRAPYVWGPTPSPDDVDMDKM